MKMPESATLHVSTLLLGIFVKRNQEEGRVMPAVKERKERKINAASTAFPSKASLPFYALKHFSDLHPKLAKFWLAKT